jgi:hypothetical protein
MIGPAGKGIVYALAGMSVAALVILFFQRTDTERVHETNKVNVKKIDKTEQEILKNMSLNRVEMSESEVDKQYHRAQAEKHGNKVLEIEEDIKKAEEAVDFFDDKAKKHYDELNKIMKVDPAKVKAAAVKADLDESFDNFDAEFENF